MKFGERVFLLALSAFVSVPLYAHGEQALVFPASFVLLLVLALVIIAISWQKLRYRVVAALTLLGSNVALWFLPVLPTTVSGLASANLGHVMLALLLIPMAVTAIVIALLNRLPRS